MFHVCGVVYNIGSSGDTDSLDLDLGSEVPAEEKKNFFFEWTQVVSASDWNRMLLLFSTDVYERQLLNTDNPDDLTRPPAACRQVEARPIIFLTLIACSLML